MTVDVPADRDERGELDEIRDVSKLIVEHPIPVYDPAWLRRLHDRCLWDGGVIRAPGFCSPRCVERYAEWEHRTTHVILGREPLQTFYEHGMVDT